MSALCNSWSFEQLASLDDAMMQTLLDKGWETGMVPDFNEVSGHRVNSSRFPEMSKMAPPALCFIAGALCTFALITARKNQ